MCKIYMHACVLDNMCCNGTLQFTYFIKQLMQLTAGKHIHSLVLLISTIALFY